MTSVRPEAANSTNDRMIDFGKVAKFLEVLEPDFPANKPGTKTHWRLRDANSPAAVGEFHLPQTLLTSPPALVVTDVDSTLILEEVIDQLAAEAGVGEKVAKITAAAMRGEIDFIQSLHARVNTLAGLAESAFEHVFARLHVTPGAKALVDWVHAQGGKFGVVSGGFTQIVQPLAKSLGIDYALAIELEVENGSLTGGISSPVVTADSKVQALKTWANKMDEELSLPAGSTLARTIAIGDGANDIPLLQTAALGIAFCAKPKVQEVVSSKLNLRQLDAISWVLEQIYSPTSQLTD